jgi:hypothetical protein
MRGWLRLRLLLHAQQGELHLLPPGVAQVPRLQRGGSMMTSPTANIASSRPGKAGGGWFFFPPAFVDGLPLAVYDITMVIPTSRLKRCGRLYWKQWNFITCQIAFVYEI